MEDKGTVVTEIPKIFIAIPSYDKKIFVPCVQGLMNAIKVCLNLGLESHYKFEVNNPYLGMARNNIVRAFMETNYTDLVMIDSDVGFPPEAFEALILSQEKVIGGVYPKKQVEELYPVLLELDKDSKTIVENGLLLAEGLPTGFLKIKRSVIEKMILAYPELAYNDCLTGKKTYALFENFVKDGRYYGDDYAFCKLWRDLGGKCHVLPNITFIHCGQKDYEGNIHDYLVKLGEKQKKEAVQ